MIASEGLLIGPAKEAGIDVPEDLENFDEEKYMRWLVFINAQIGQPMPSPNAHFENAKVVATVSREELKVISMESLIDLGFSVGFSS